MFFDDEVKSQVQMSTTLVRDAWLLVTQPNTKYHMSSKNDMAHTKFCMVFDLGYKGQGQKSSYLEHYTLP